jgi:hypothetical protein
VSIKKYALLPGPIRSITDGQRHFIGARQLAQLYGVKMSECIGVDRRHSTWGLDRSVEYVLLGPRSDGNYQLPEDG